MYDLYFQHKTAVLPKVKKPVVKKKNKAVKKLGFLDESQGTVSQESEPDGIPGRFHQKCDNCQRDVMPGEGQECVAAYCRVTLHSECAATPGFTCHTQSEFDSDFGTRL